MRWNFNKYNFDYQNLPAERDIEYYANYLRSSKFVHSFNYFLEDSTLIITRFMLNKIWQTLILNKQTKSYRIIKRFTQNVVPPATSVFFNKGIMTSIDQMKAQILINEKVLNNRNLLILKGLNATDNPVLVKYYLKRTQ